MSHSGQSLGVMRSTPSPPVTEPGRQAENGFSHTLSFRLSNEAKKVSFFLFRQVKDKPETLSKIINLPETK